jgi:vacuolar-type H+-ATPase subunit H
MRVSFNPSVLTLAILAAIGLGASGAAVGQDRVLLVNENDDGTQSGTANATEQFWLGVSCVELSDELRNELKLGEENGVVVMDVVPDSPAAKADLKKNDVLLAAGDDDLGTPRDLVKVVRRIKDKELKLKIIRNGERKEVTVKPERRLSASSGQVEVYGEPFNVRIFRPGHVLPPQIAIRLKRRDLPDDMTVTISKHGKEPAKVTVTQGDKSWEVTEDKLDELPEEIRPHVEPMLGRFAMPLPPGVSDALYYVPDAAALHARAHEAPEAAQKAGREAEAAGRQAAREAEEVGRDAVRQAEEQAREIVRHAREKAREARNTAEKAAREQADAAIEHGRAWIGKQYDEKLDEVDRRLEELRRIVNALRESRKAPAPEKTDAKKP